MITVWAVSAAGYLIGPVNYRQGASFQTWAYIAASIGAFCLGCGGSRPYKRPVLCREVPDQRSNRQIDRVVRRTAIVGLFGIVLLLIDKLVLGGLDFSQGATAVRFERAAEVAANTSGDLPRSPLLYLGYATFPFSVPAFLIYLMRPEALRRRTVILTYASLSSPVLYAGVYGGRSPIALLLLFMGGAIAVCRIEGRRSAAGKLSSKAILAGLVAVFVIYSSLIFAQRDEYRKVTSFDDLVARTEASYDAVTSSWLRDAKNDDGTTGSLRSNILYLSYYLTHEIPMLDRTLERRSQLGPYLGQYQFFWPAIVLRQISPSLSYDARITNEGFSANIYGWFSTAWGGTLLDFGLLGGLLCAFIYGKLYRRIYTRAMVDGDLRAKLLLSYAIVGVLTSPILSIFTISISFLVLAAIAVSGLFLPRSQAIITRSLSTPAFAD